VLNDRERKYIEDLICDHLEDLADEFTDGKVEAERLVEELLTTIRVIRRLDLDLSRIQPSLQYLLEAVVREVLHQRPPGASSSKESS